MAELKTKEVVENVLVHPNLSNLRDLQSGRTKISSQKKFRSTPSMRDDTYKYTLAYKTPWEDLHLKILIKEFMVHMLYPLTYFYYPKPHFFSPLIKGTIGDFFVLVAPMLFWTLCILAYLSGEVYNCFFACAMFCLHRLAIALKYASLNRQEYFYVMHLEDMETISKVQSEMHTATMLSSANRVPLSEFFILAASVKSGINIHDAFFLLQNPARPFDILNKSVTDHEMTGFDFLETHKPFDLWEEFLVENLQSFHSSILDRSGSLVMKSTKEGEPILPLVEFLRAMIWFASEHATVPWLLRGYSVAFAGMVINTIPLFYVDCYDSLSLATSVISVLLGFPFTCTLLMFFQMMTINLLRQHRIAQVLSRLIRTESMNLELHNELLKWIPVVDMTHTINVHTWVTARLISQKLLERYKFREDCYLGFTLIATVLMYGNFTYALMFDPGSIRIFEEPFILQLFVVNILAACLIQYYIFVASLTNREFDKQKRLLIVGAVKMETMLAVDLKREQSDVSEENQSNNFRRPIEDIEKTIEGESNLSP